MDLILFILWRRRANEGIPFTTTPRRLGFMEAAQCIRHVHVTQLTSLLMGNIGAIS